MTLGLLTGFIAKAGDGFAPPATNQPNGGLVWGAETNGYRAAVFVAPNHNLVIVSVRIPKDWETKGTPSSLPGQTNSASLSHVWWPGAMCFLPTNWFCGPVELRNAAGQFVPQRHPEVSQPQAYPESYSINRVLHSLPRVVYLGWPQVRPLFSGNQLGSFNLTDYFKIAKLGEYQLTVRPKLYKRVKVGADLVQRIDFAPVTVRINIK